MQTAWKVRGLGLALLVAALPAFLFVAEPLGGMLAFALAVTGLFVAVVVAEPAVPARFGQSLVDADQQVLDDVAEGLGMQGGPVYVHDQGNVGAERLFLAASDNDRPVPILDRETLAYAGTGATKVGLAVEPPGLRLVRRHEDEAPDLPSGAAVAEVEAFLSGLFATHDLVRGLSLTKADEGLRLRFRPGAIDPPCLGEPLDPACQRTGCAVCQAAGCALARSLGQPVAVHDATIEDDRVRLEMTPRAGAGRREADDEQPSRGPARDRGEQTEARPGNEPGGGPA